MLGTAENPERWPIQALFWFEWVGECHARVDFVGKLPGRNANVSQHQTDQLEYAEVVSGRWLVKAILAMLAIGGGALYLTVCFLFYQGQWQFTFFPPKNSSPGIASIAAKSGLPITNVRFDTTEEGVEQLDGWWIPAVNPADVQSSSPANADTHRVVLFYPNGRTDLPDNVDAFMAFHALGVDVFAFDYRGFGASQAGHPSQRKAYADGLAAMNYLTGTRHIPPNHIVVYGARLGAAVAAHIALQSPKIAGIILEDPQPSLTEEVKREQHIHLLPLWLVLQDRFNISDTVPLLKMPKLIVVTGAMRDYAPGAAKLYNKALAPRQKIAIDNQPNQPVYLQPAWRNSVGDFLSTFAPQPANPGTPRVP